jgi:hypothetical protein
MTPAVAILHTATIASAPVRFFRSPLSVPDLPWHAVNDLHSALRLPSDLSKTFKYRLKREWKADLLKVRVDGAPLLIAPHFMAQGLIGAMVEMGVAPASTDLDYRLAGAAAFEAEAALLGLSAAEAGRRALQAVTGKTELKATPKFDPVSGQRVYRMDELAAELGLSDEEICRSLEGMEAAGLSRPVAPSELETLQ